MPRSCLRRRPCGPPAALAGLACAAASLVLVLEGCSSWKERVADRSRLRGDAKGELGQKLEVSIQGAQPALAASLLEAVRAELEGADLFEDVDEARERPASAPASRPATAPVGTTSAALDVCARLDLSVRDSVAAVCHDFWSQTDGYVVRYELDAVLLDRTGATVLEGPVSGIGYDDVSDPDALNEPKRTDIAAAARRNAAGKIGRALRAAAEVRAKAAFEKLGRIRLPPGVGPVPIAVLGFDDDPASRRRRGLALARALAPTIARLGPDLTVVPPEEVEAELHAEPSEQRPRSFLDLKAEDFDRLVPRLGARLFVVGRIEGGGGRFMVQARVVDAQLHTLGETQAEAEGPGALKLVAVDIARELGKTIESKPPAVVPRREDD